MKTVGALESFSAKFHSEKKQFLVLGVQKYIAVMRSFLIWQIWCETKTIFNNLNLMVMVTSFMLDWEYTFAKILSKKSVVFNLILICSFHW